MVASTQPNLRALVASGAFREDLFYRIAVVEAPLPPLREHGGRVPRAAEAMGVSRQFLHRLLGEYGIEPA